MATCGEGELQRLLEEHMPLKKEVLRLTRGSKAGLVIIDEVNGFCTVGMGNLAPPVPNSQISTMVAETLDLAQKFSAKKWPILATLDTHEADKPEPPYPPHCIRGTGEELLVDELKWLERDESATLMEKDCINAFVGGMTNDGSNVIIDWVQKNDLELILTVGICTDICVMDFVLTALSARNHGLLGSTLKTIAVYTAGCSTYSLPRRVAESLGFGPQSAHPQTPTHHMGLYFMHSRGALLVDSVTIDEED